MKKLSCALLILYATSAFAGPSVSVDALFWKTTETADWAFVLDPTNDFQGVSIKTTYYRWDPGFRVGAGWSSCGCLGFDLQYTRFQTDTTNSIDGGRIQAEFFGPKLSLLGFFQKAELRSQINYNVVDALFGARLCPNSCLTIRPKFGVRGAWIDQKIRTSWTKFVDVLNILEFPVTANENLTNDFRGIGPLGGIEGQWCFSDCLKVVGDISGSFLWGHFRFTDFYSDSLGSKVDVRIPSRDFGAFAIQTFLGLGFDKGLFSAEIGYELQDWFNQYQVFDDGTGGQSGDLIFQGLTLRIRLDF